MTQEKSREQMVRKPGKESCRRGATGTTLPTDWERGPTRENAVQRAGVSVKRQAKSDGNVAKRPPEKHRQRIQEAVLDCLPDIIKSSAEIADLEKRL